MAWIGKGRRPRQVRIGPVFEARLERWERAYARGLDRPVGPDDPVVVPVSGRAAVIRPAATSWRPG